MAVPANTDRGNRTSGRRAATAGRWTPAIAAASVLGVVVFAGLSGRGDNRSVESAPAAVSTSASTAGVTIPASTQPNVVIESTTLPVTKTAIEHPLSYGMAGEDVKALQARLKQLAFDPGDVDGSFGERTRSAVWAFEKLVLKTPREQATGVVTPDMWSTMQDPILIQPRRPNSTPSHTEIYLPEQVLIVFDGQSPVLITHISSGDGKEWCDEVTIDVGEYGNEQGTEPLKRGECGLSWTPGGVYHYERMVQGIRNGALGSLYNPVYFNYGIAVHGAQNVPLYPASHGCVRIPMFIAEYFQQLVAKNDEVFVWDGVREPEYYGAQKPRFNWRDPNYTTTTSSTTTTTSSSTTTSTTSTVPASSPVASGTTTVAAANPSSSTATTSAPTPPTTSP